DTLGFVHLTAPTGTIHTMPTLEEIRSQPGVIHAELKVSAGQVMGDATADSNTRAGRVVVAAPDTDAAVKALEETAAWFTSWVTVDTDTAECTTETAC
ncbi:hypothetical protein ACFZDI_11215, partial [Streptomyces sp. NPDC007907]|uniref:hypothetical protein n=1 Tax=Streptomyces sp. NPDC007907 TaxID=3364789 RepID=UPI0036E48E0C